MKRSTKKKLKSFLLRLLITPIVAGTVSVILQFVFNVESSPVYFGLGLIFGFVFPLFNPFFSDFLKNRK